VLRYCTLRYGWAPIVGVVLALSLTARAPAAEHAGHIPIHHQLTVRIDPQRSALAATDHIRVAASAAPSLTRFALARTLSVDRLVVDGTTLAIDPRAGHWPLELDSRGPHDLIIEYHGVVVADSADDADLVLEPAGTFLIGDGWYPTFDTDMLSYDLTVEVPGGQLVVAPGKLLAETSTPQHYRARFAAEGPVEAITLFAGPYQVQERRHANRRLRTYFDPSVADLAASYLQKTAQYLDLYQTWIGTYPYAGFDVVSGQRPLGLGFPGLTYVGTMVLRLPFLLDTSLGHEVLHSWWGNAVLIDLSHGNWAEGLTTFMADYTFAERKSEEAARAMRERWIREYAALPAGAEQPLTAFRSRHHTASQVVGYHKAAMVFAMLRDEIGRVRFDHGIRRFWERNRFRRASWADLRQAFEATAGRSLAGFFAQWIERSGAPVITIRDTALRSVDGVSLLSFVLEQPDPVYQLRIPVGVRSAGQSGDAAVVRLNGSRQRYELRVAARSDQVCIDPDFRLFRRPLPGEVAPILRGVVFDISASTLIAATDPQAHAAAEALAVRLLERRPVLGDAGAALPVNSALLIGTDAEVAVVLSREGISGPPQRIAGRGTGRAWATHRPGKGVLVVISGHDASALTDMSAPLPHYGSDSFVVFEGRRATDHGVWPAGTSPLCVDLSSANDHGRNAND